MNNPRSGSRVKLVFKQGAVLQLRTNLVLELGPEKQKFEAFARTKIRCRINSGSRWESAVSTRF